jgi:hypothetical protein
MDQTKDMLCRYDLAVRLNGGKTIFAAKPQGVASARADRWLAKWEYPLPRRAPRPAEQLGRPAHIPKPQRILARTFGIIGEGSLSDFDEMEF